MVTLSLPLVEREEGRRRRRNTAKLPLPLPLPQGVPAFPTALEDREVDTQQRLFLNQGVINWDPLPMAVILI